MGEILSEPAAGARYGGTLLWVIVIAVITKASWNEAIGRVSIATGQSFLEACRGAGPIVAWVPWAWYAVNSVKDFFLRGGIMAIGGSVCFDTFGPLPDWLVPPVSMLPWLGSLPVEQQIAKLHTHRLDSLELRARLVAVGCGRVPGRGENQHRPLSGLHALSDGLCGGSVPSGRR